MRYNTGMERFDFAHRPDAELFDSAFELVKASFPPSEYRYRDTLLGMLDWPTYAMYIEHQASRATGLICSHEFGGMRFVETFCISPGLRGAGRGGRMLDEYVSLRPGPVVLEVEPPEDELTRRRVGFYRRHGFELDERDYVMPPLEPELPPLKLLLMSTQPLGADFEAVRDAIYRTVYRVEPRDVPRLG